jgi:hemoglobin/transferrin/lactoferrin receptor protein
MRALLRVVSACALVLFLSSPAVAGGITGTAADVSGGVLVSARITLRNLASGVEKSVRSGADGRFAFPDVADGSYLVLIEADGFAVDTRTVTVSSDSASHDLRFALTPGAIDVGVTVTATRSERAASDVPVRTDTLSREALQSRTPLSTGDALLQAPGITAVGSGPMQVRPRLRGLDSTRLLVLVDGERLNNARTATDRSGTEVGLIDLASVDSLEVVSGSGSVLYGTDALAGTVNIITNQPKFSDTFAVRYGFDGFSSSNENGRRGTVTLGASSKRFAFQFAGTLEDFGDYRAGKSGANEDTRRYYSDGTLKNEDTIDHNFGFSFGAFPDPFNAPYTRSSAVIPTSSARGSSINASGLVALTSSQTLQVKYVQRRMEDVGFPDFKAPIFFSRVTLPYNDFDRFSARYEARNLTSWFTNLRASAYVQESRRLLRNEFPVQFPVPSPQFFPISVYRLNLTTDTEQFVRTPGLDVQATFVPARHHVVTTGMMAYDDLSRDSRTSTTETTVIGAVALGARGPAATVYPTPVVLGAPSVTHPARVPDASFRNLGVFAQDEWDLTRNLRVVAGLRADHYRVTTDPTPGYDVASLVEGAVPAIDPATLPNVSGDRLSRRAVTGDVGLVFRPADGLSLIARYGRSYRHANLEELLFSGPATVGAIVPNMAVKPETGHNVDLGLRLRAGRGSASLSYFNNTYDGFISTELVAETPDGPLSQAINFTDVRIQGVEASADAPFVLRPGVLTFFGNAAYTRGTVLAGTNRLTGASLAGTPQDNITPFKAIAGVRFTESRDRWWIEYGARIQSDVNRVAPTLLESPYLIAQDLLSLQGFVVQRVAFGVNVRAASGRLGLVCAVENLADRFYREQFQFAPARGRSVTVGVTVRGK